MTQVGLGAAVRAARRCEDHAIAGAPTGFDEAIGEYPHRSVARSQRRGDSDRGMRAGRHLGGHVDPDVVAAGQKGRHQDRGPVGRQVGEHLAGRRAEHIDK